MRALGGFIWDRFVLTAMFVYGAATLILSLILNQCMLTDEAWPTVAVEVV